MKFVEQGDYIYITFETTERESQAQLKRMLLGYTEYRDKMDIKAENNVVNRIVLGLNPLGYRDMKHTCRLYQDERLELYQKDDILKGAFLGNVLNRNRMGFGKTVETIMMLKAWDARDVVIVAPKPVCHQWKKHYEVWWPEMYDDVGVFDLKASTVVLNYEKLLQPKVMASLRGRRHHAVVFDEVHKLKNKSSKRTIAAKEIPAQHHVGLTGTPILKHPDDLWSELHSIDWHYSGKYYWNFVKYFCNVVDGYFGRTIEGLTKDVTHVAILHKLLDLVSLYNGDIEVAQGKRVVEVELEMTKHQADLYKKIKKLELDNLPENCTIANGAVLAMRLQQTTSWPGLFGVDVAGAKFEWIADFCSNTDEPVVVFTRFEKTARALKSYLSTKCKIDVALYVGTQNDKEREGSKQAFINGNAQVIIGTIGAMGTGVDDLQKRARLGIMMEKDWSPEINAQCEDRLHRKEQTSPVVWYYLSCTKSFDKHVGKVNLNKARAIREALASD